MNVKETACAVGHVYNIKYNEHEDTIVAVNTEGRVSDIFSYPLEGKLKELDLSTKFISWSIWDFAEKVAGKKKIRRN